MSRADRAERRREELLQISLRLFSERGFEGTSIRDIAREAGITEGLIYHYFQSKKDLLKTVVEESVSDPEAFQDFLDRLESLPIRQALSEIGRRLLETLREKKEIFRLMLAESRLFEQNDDHFYPKLIYEGKMIRVGAFLKKRMERGEIREMKPVLLARQFTGSLVAFFIFQEILQGKMVADVTDADFLNSWVDVFVNGARSPFDGR